MTTPNMKYGIMTTNTRKGRFLRPDSSNRAKLGRLLCKYTLLLLLMVTGAIGAWGQTDYSGTYYIGSVGYKAANTTTNYYLCPTEDWCSYKATDDFEAGDNMPFLTTYQCRNGVYDATKAVWYVEKDPNSSYYYIRQAKTGRYLVANGVIRTTNSGQDRMRVHLEEITNLNEAGKKVLFSIVPYSTYLVISPKEIVDGNYYTAHNDHVNHRWLTVNGGNKNSLTGQSGKTGGPTGYENTAGIIGIYTQTDVNTPFYLEKATIDPPTITNNYDGTVTITAASGATIYYTTDETTPTTSTTTTGTTPVTITLDGTMTVIKALAKSTNDYFPTIVTTYNIPKCPKPEFTFVDENHVTISCSIPGATISYGIDSDPTTTYTSGTQIDISAASFIKARAISSGYLYSDVAIYSHQITVHNSSAITVMEGSYLLADDFVSTASIGTSTAPFKGVIDGQMNTLYESGTLDHPLVAYAEGAVIKNVILKKVGISQSGNVGAIVGVAAGYTRIYNCGILPNDATNSSPSTVKSTDGYCGGLVGWLKDDSRVINCFSYANITGGTDVAGIVGHNEIASTTAVTTENFIDRYANLRTAVVNCMFYGNITGGSSIYPVYGGEKMLNTGNDGINNYDFYRAEASITPTDDNCSWPASEENLTRFEYYRSLLNANRELCGWWVGSDVAPSTLTTAQVQAIPKDASIMAKWVLDPAIAPYPILKSAGKYFSVINIDPARRTDPDSKAWVSRNTSDNTIETNAAPDLHGEILGSITVNIVAGSHHSGSDSRPITITAMDIDNNDFCYGKIQLPYYNEIFGNPNGTTWSEKYGDNYTDMVVTGWDITTSEGTAGTFSDDPITGYNFADRNCTAKDTHRTFAQGGYYYVPYGVSEITITAHWANAYYLSNTGGNYERVYLSSGTTNTTSSSAGQPFAPAGTRSFTNGEFGGQTIRNGTIISVLNLNTVARASSVYDCAIVLVGNYQHRNSTIAIADNNKNKPFTLMTVDLDFDNEPDYCLEWQIGGGDKGVTRTMINPVRFDFLPIVDLGIAMKENDSKYLYAIGKLTPYGHFEVTETALLHMGQFEYENKNRAIEGPVILNNGIYDQICRGSEGDDEQNINYFILGGHVKMPSFTPGSHVNYPFKSRHCAVNVLGGEITKFYLSGNYNATPTNEGDPHCYIDGGKFDFVASGAKEQIVGNVFWKIDHAYIGEFYGGGISADKRVKGNISITMNRSKVTKFCGGPQFGDMESGMTVTTSATGTTFGVFYGAGNGGTSYSQYDKSDVTSETPNSYDWESVSNNASGRLANYTALTYRNKATGYHAKYELEMINSSAGTINNAVCRTYMYAAQFATTNTGTVSSTLTDCTVETDFFGGGLLGGVTGDVTSILQGNTKVQRNVYGAGYGIAELTVDVLPKGYTPPSRNENTAVITPPTYPTPTTYYWTHETTFGSTTLSKNSPAILNPNGDGKNYLYTEIPLVNLGTVSGDVTLTIDGTSTVAGNVFGGGESSTVGGSVIVNIKNGTVSTDVYGGGALANTNTDGVAKTTTVNLTGGTINGNVYGGAMGDAETSAKVGTVLVKLNGTPTQETVQGETVTVYNDQCVVKGSIFGCNNVNGTPLGNVEVHVYKTWGAARTSVDDLESIDDTKHKYHLAAVYGGGNLAAYEPTDLTNSKAHVIIDGCDLTSIRQVYGGGNAASTPATQVDVHGTYEIEELFGGGNGKDQILVNGVLTDNPGANVGYYDYSAYENSTDPNTGAATKELRLANYTYGTGQASVNVYGGLIHRVYGGSNTKGNVRVVAVTMLEESGVCEFQVDEAYGGGKSAPMDGEAKLIMSCIPGLKVAYGGAENAEIHNNVTLNITNGTFDRVFGGNNISGIIDGTITVNVQETGCRAVVIGQLYGGGNQAPYTAPFKPNSTTEREPGPTINVNSFTSIGEIYGGGYGATAIVTGDTYVNINAYKGLYASTAYAEKEKTISFAEFRRTADGGFALDGEGNRIIDAKSVTVTLPGHEANKMGAIYNVYGGGNAARVIGNTHVNIGTAMGEDVYEVVSVTAGTSLAGLGYYTRTGEGTTSSPYEYHDATGTASATTTYYQKKTVLGADIHGNVYGGGNEAIVTGSTDVNIGVEPTP